MQFGQILLYEIVNYNLGTLFSTILYTSNCPMGYPKVYDTSVFASKVGRQKLRKVSRFVHCPVLWTFLYKNL